MQHQTDAWNQHYQRPKSKQLYPDENLVRLLKQIENDKANHFDFSKSTVLDYGFGSGRHLRLLTDSGCKRIIGCEASEVALNEAKPIFTGIDLRLVTSTIQRLPFDTGSFDLILCWGVLHYLDDAGQKHLVSEFQRLLRTGGFVVGTLRSANDTHFKHSDVGNTNIQLFDQNQAESLLRQTFDQVQLGHSERTILGRVDLKISHWFFKAQKT